MVIDNHMEDKFYRRTNKLQLVMSSSWLIYGEMAQQMASAGLRDYSWMTGHLSDIAGGVGFASLINLFSKNADKKLSLVAASSVPLFISLNEEVFDKSGDWQDIACYLGGALIAWSMPRIKEIYTDTKEYFKSLRQKDISLERSLARYVPR